MLSLSHTDVIQIDATVIIGVIILLTFQAVNSTDDDTRKYLNALSDAKLELQTIREMNSVCYDYLNTGKYSTPTINNNIQIELYDKQIEILETKIKKNDDNSLNNLLREVKLERQQYIANAIDEIKSSHTILGFYSHDQLFGSPNLPKFQDLLWQRITFIDVEIRYLESLNTTASLERIKSYKIDLQNNLEDFVDLNVGFQGEDWVWFEGETGIKLDDIQKLVAHHKLTDFEYDGRERNQERWERFLGLELIINIPSGTDVPGCEETNECYVPSSVAIDVGTQVTWTNNDSAAHTVTNGSPADGPGFNFDSSLFMAGTTFSHKFEEYGEFPYFCMVHPWMTGLVTVQENRVDFSAPWDRVSNQTNELQTNFDNKFQENFLEQCATWKVDLIEQEFEIDLLEREGSKLNRFGNDQNTDPFVELFIYEIYEKQTQFVILINLINLLMVSPFAISAIIESINAIRSGDKTDKASKAGIRIMIIGFGVVILGLILILGVSWWVNNPSLN